RAHHFSFVINEAGKLNLKTKPRPQEPLRGIFRGRILIFKSRSVAPAIPEFSADHQPVEFSELRV
ncbi:MAG: hypothetical protein RLZZ144_233, partial [Pseudomonadota bacterium]